MGRSARAAELTVGAAGRAAFASPEPGRGEAAAAAAATRAGGSTGGGVATRLRGQGSHPNRE